VYDQERAKRFRQYAAELLGWAEQTEFQEQEQKRTLLTIAAMYHVLARHFEDEKPATS
jgi:hypothetical protein